MSEHVECQKGSAYSAAMISQGASFRSFAVRIEPMKKDQPWTFSVNFIVSNCRAIGAW